MRYRCPICAQEVSEDLVVYVDHTEKHIIDVIKSDHPDWIEKSGLCTRCLEYYHAEINGTLKVPFMHPTRCMTRRKKIWRFLTSFWKKPV
ncbi:MAG: hypothetical protein NUV91_08020 [Candidatus Omnitrophica bacterium]|nr:hypothetical protein [Candidatus Omnitrophota bacterium]